MNRRYCQAMPVDHRLLGKVIREIRESKQLSQESLGALSNLSRTHIGAIERGDVTLSFASLVLISEGLGCQISEIIQKYEKRNQ